MPRESLIPAFGWLTLQSASVSDLPVQTTHLDQRRQQRCGRSIIVSADARLRQATGDSWRSSCLYSEYRLASDSIPASVAITALAVESKSLSEVEGQGMDTKG